MIVDSFGSPTIRHDLTEYDTQNGLPAPPSFNIITPEGAVPPYNPDNATMGGWALETSLDVEMAHTMAPGANILLVETPVAETVGIDGFPQIEKAIQFVVHEHLGNVITQSFGAAEQTFAGGAAQIKSLEYAYQDAANNGVTVLASSGDQGPTSAMANGNFFEKPVVNWPASDPLVTGVGGTQLHLTRTERHSLRRTSGTTRRCSVARRRVGAVFPPSSAARHIRTACQASSAPAAACRTSARPLL